MTGPCQPATRRRCEQLDVERCGSQKRPAVLIVEDEAIPRLDLATELEAQGFDIFEAADGEAGLTVARDHPEIDAAVIDVDLPGGIAGYDVVRALRQMRPSCRIVMISGRRFAMPADFDEHVVVESKPFDPHKIAFVLRRRLPGDN